MSKPTLRIRLMSLSALSATLFLMLAGCSSGSKRVVASPTATAPLVIPCTPTAPVTAPAVTAAGAATVALPNAPFGSIATADGQWIFVSLDAASASNTTTGIAVLRRSGQSATLQHVIALGPDPDGMALTHDGKYLIVADYNSVAILDVAKAEMGQASAVLGTIPTGPSAVTLEVTVSLDDAFVFASDEHEAPPYTQGDISVIDLHRALAGAYSEAAIAGQVLLDAYPVGIALSPNGADLYVTNRFSVTPSTGYVPSPNASDLGSLIVVDVARAETDPSHAVVAKALAGCGPVRVVLSPAGDVAWVSAQLQNAVLALDTAKLASDPGHALLATVPTGPAPTGIAVIDNGAGLLVTCSNRFASPTAPQEVMLIDTQRALHGQSALAGSIAVGAFPREIALDQSLALVTNFGSQSLSLIDTTTLPA